MCFTSCVDCADGFGDGIMEGSTGIEAENKWKIDLKIEMWRNRYSRIDGGS